MGFVLNLPSEEFVKGLLGMFTGADWVCSILDDIPADIEFSISNCAAKTRRVNWWIKCTPIATYLSRTSKGVSCVLSLLGSTSNHSQLPKSENTRSSDYDSTSKFSLSLPASKLPVKTLEMGLTTCWNCLNCYWLLIVSYLMCYHSSSSSVYC